MTWRVKKKGVAWYRKRKDKGRKRVTYREGLVNFEEVVMRVT